MKNKQKIDEYIKDNNIEALMQELFTTPREKVMKYILQSGQIDIHNNLEPSGESLMLRAVSGVNNSLALILFDFGFDMKKLKKKNK